MHRRRLTGCVPTMVVLDLGMIVMIATLGMQGLPIEEPIHWLAAGAVLLTLGLGASVTFYFGEAQIRLG
jgi:hypothetical protein